MIGDVTDDAADVGTEGETEPAENPDDGYDAHGNETLHHDGEHIFPAYEAAVKEGESRGHEADQRRTEQNECGIS